MRHLARLRSTAFGAGGLLAFALLAGRLSGLIRELTLASYFGVSATADIAVVLLTLPDLLVNLLLSGGLSAALVPRLRALPNDQAGVLFRAACYLAMAVFGSLALLIALWPGLVFALFAPGLQNPVAFIGRPAIILLSLSIPLTALSGITAAYLNSRERFFVAGLGTLIFNLAIIVALIGFSRDNGLFLLAASILVGATIRLASQSVIVPRHAWQLRTGSSWLDQRFLTAFGAGIAATSLTLVPPAFVRAAGSLLGTGNIATINYAQKLVELPLGILITTISTIALTRLSGQYAQNEHDAARHTLHQALRLSLLLAVLIVLFGEFLAEPVASLLFLRGAINGEDVSQIAALMRVILLGVPFIAISSLAAAALNAQLRTAEVLQATAVSILLLVVLAVPGLIYFSDLLLMGAVVGSQAALAWFLARRAGICLWGADGIVGRHSLTVAGAGLAVAMVFVTGVLFASPENGLVTIILGAISFAAAVGISAVLARR